MLEILYLGSNFKNYKASYYQNDLLNSLIDLHAVKCWGPGFNNYNEELSINQVINKLKLQPELIIISNTWEIQDINEIEFDLNPKIKLYETCIPKLFFINKEYKKLDKKLEFIKKNNIDYVTTVLKEKCTEWENITGSKFFWEPFGINFKQINFIEDRPKRKYDFGFTGNLHKTWINERITIKKHIFKEEFMNFKIFHNIYHTKRYKVRYASLKIYWGEWNEKRLFFPFYSRAPFGKKYFNLIANFKLSLNTKSALGIINPRFFELMGSKTLILCPKDNYYGLLEDGYNCLMYNDLDDFDEKLIKYSSDEDLRLRIVKNAYNFVSKYKWENIMGDILSKIEI